MRPIPRMTIAVLLLLFVASPLFAEDNPFVKHGKLRVAKSGTYLEHADGTPFFFLADTAWTGPALSTEAEWKLYLADRKKKGFTAIQFNAICPWRTAATDLEGRTAYDIKEGSLVPNENYFKRLDSRLKAINDAGLLAAPVLVWAHKKGDAGFDLPEEHIITLVKFELQRYKDANCLFILAGDARYNQPDAEKWKRVGQSVSRAFPDLLMTTHPTGMNFPWKSWEEEKWLNVLGYQSGHGDDANTVKWIHSGPIAEYGLRKEFTRPVINLEPPYENHNGYQSRKPHSAYNVRRAVYQSLLAAPIAGFTYGGHGVWSWHTKPGEEPTDHKGTGVAKVWKDALALPGAEQMGFARKFFETLPWTELRPAQSLVTQESGKDDSLKFVSCAKTENNSLFVFYFPAGATASVKVSVRTPKGVTWFNPRTGVWDDKKPKALFVPPDEEDWLMVVKP